MTTSATTPNPANLLDAEALIAAAVEQAGSGFSDTASLRTHLQRWIDTLLNDVPLTEMGAAVQRQKIHQLLVNRARMEADLLVHPEIRDEVIAAPIVIFGLPRTGTTKLLRLLGEGNGFTSIPYWWLTNPAPFGPVDRNHSDPRIAAAQASVTVLKQAFPDFIAAHPTEADAPDEEVFALDMTFQSFASSITLPSLRYQQDMLRHPHDETYDFLRLLLQYRQWQFPETRGKTLVMKSPVHFAFVPLLLERFPEATLVQCHRDVAVSVPSLCRLFEAVWSMCAEPTEPAAVGSLVVEVWAEAAARNLAQRSALPDGARLVDIQFEDTVERPDDAVARILDAHGIDSATSVSDASRWREAPAARYGTHDYSLKRYALHAEAVREAFGPYCQLAHT